MTLTGPLPHQPSHLTGWDNPLPSAPPWEQRPDRTREMFGMPREQFHNPSIFSTIFNALRFFGKTFFRR
jgi:hypothetical protein